MPDASVAHVPEVHRRSVIIDARDPSFLTNRQIPREKASYWDAIQEGGVTSVIVDVPWTDDGFREASINFAQWLERIRAADQAMLVKSADDFTAAKDQGKVGVVLSSQTPTPIEDDLHLLRVMYELGLRVMQLSYQRRNLIADGCGEPIDGGVSAFGRDVIAEMNRLGIAIDLSHASDRTMLDAIELSEQPVFFSHSNARAVVDHVRNVPDEILRRVADSGGVCCVSAYSEFLKPQGSKVGTDPTAMAEMARYLVNLMGAEHVGIGLDVGEEREAAEVAMIGGGQEIEKRYSLLTRRDYPRITMALEQAGLSEDQIELVLGKSLVQYFGRVWRD
jgi:membrane dipeptidase